MNYKSSFLKNKNNVACKNNVALKYEWVFPLNQISTLIVYLTSINKHVCR